MANPDMRQTLDIPNGTTFEFKDGKLIFGHETDIVIRTNLGGYKFQKIFSKKGSVQVVPPEGVEFDVDEIEAAEGDVFLNGRVRVRSARGRTIHFQEGHLVADRLEARDEVVLAGDQIDVVHVKAPRVQVKAEARGTCLVIESQNDPGPIRARGCFRSPTEAQAAFARLSGAPAAAGSASPATSKPAAAPPSPAAAVSMPPAGSPPGAEPHDDPTEDLDRTAIASAGESGPATEEFRIVDPDSTSPALPKSSVFRKRR
jgi:hypothetical protein